MSLFLCHNIITKKIVCFKKQILIDFSSKWNNLVKVDNMYVWVLTRINFISKEQKLNSINLYILKHQINKPLTKKSNKDKMNS